MWRCFFQGILIVLVITSIIPSTFTSAESQEEAFSLKLTDANGNDLRDPLFGDVTIYFDTYDTPEGTIYKLKAMLSIKTIPANIRITSTGGLFKLSVSATGAGSFLEETGMRFTVIGGDDSLSADLRKENQYSDEFKNGANSVIIQPNLDYAVSANLIDEYESVVVPESVNNIKITFQAEATDGFHEVAFISEGQIIESYLVFDNGIIDHVPQVSRNGYSFKGWFTPDGREITAGYVISPNEGDIIAVAEWEYIGNNNMIYIAGVGGGAAAAALLLLLLLKKRKGDSG